jgi:UDPglucose 6-dehydrogenase
MARIAVIGGAGYVGLTYAAAFAELGHEVIGLDVDGARVRALCGGQTPIYEPGLEALLQKALASGRLRFTVSAAEALPSAEFAFICVGTPSDPFGRVDVRTVVAAAQTVGQHACGHTVVVNKSTMPVGSVEMVAGILSEHASFGASFDVVANPEFLREGSAIRDVFHPDRIILGATDRAAAEAVGSLYDSLDAPIVITDARSAEMTKYASNAFLATKISFINEIAMICEALGVDVGAVANGMGMDDRIGPRFLRAGVGFGGSCFPKDVRGLAGMAREAGVDPTMLDAVLGINETMRKRLVAKLTTHLGDLEGKKIALLGLAFKPGTDDIREAPALAVIRELLAAGATVRATDPVAMDRVFAELPEVTLVDDPYAAAMGADAVVLLTEWEEYRAIDLEHLANAMRGRVLVDGRNALDPAGASQAGLVYEGVGRGMAEVKLPTLFEFPVRTELAAD